jgi:hypothetical protein
MPNDVHAPQPKGLDLIDRGPRWLRTLADCATEPMDDSEARIRQRSLVMSAAIGAVVVLPWALF